MKLAIMQPYFFPYIGYFQLINAVDTFVLYDNIEYTKKGWINRNRFLLNGKDSYFTIPLKSDSDYLSIKERNISDEFNKNKLLNQISNAYRKAPYYDRTFPVFKNIIEFDDNNLFRFIYNSILDTCKVLGINTKFIISSDIPIDHKLKSSEKVLAICKKLNADTYINAIGGMELYSKNLFKDNSVDLHFINTDKIEYTQFENTFVPWLSILDIMMFNNTETINDYINNKYSII